MMAVSRRNAQRGCFGWSAIISWGAVLDETAGYAKRSVSGDDRHR